MAKDIGRGGPPARFWATTDQSRVLSRGQARQYRAGGHHDPCDPGKNIARRLAELPKLKDAIMASRCIRIVDIPQDKIIDDCG
jgi:hypothetical protein